MYSQNIGFSSTWKNFILCLISFLHKGVIGRKRYKIISSKLRRNFESVKQSFINKAVTYSTVMKFIVDNLYAGKIGQRAIQRHAQLRSMPQKGVQGDLKGPELKLGSDHRGRSTSTLTGTGDFSSSWGLMTINHLRQQKDSFSFHIWWRQSC